jgi:hypothetical protein
MLWAFAFFVTTTTVLALYRQPQFNAFRPMHLALVFASGLVIGAAVARTRAYFRGE